MLWLMRIKESLLASLTVRSAHTAPDLLGSPVLPSLPSNVRPMNLRRYSGVHIPGPAAISAINTASEREFRHGKPCDPRHADAASPGQL